MRNGQAFTKATATVTSFGSILPFCRWKHDTSKLLHLSRRRSVARMAMTAANKQANTSKYRPFAVRREWMLHAAHSLEFTIIIIIISVKGNLHQTVNDPVFVLFVVRYYLSDICVYVCKTVVVCISMAALRHSSLEITFIIYFYFGNIIVCERACVSVCVCMWFMFSNAILMSVSLISILWFPYFIVSPLSLCSNFSYPAICGSGLFSFV